MKTYAFIDASNLFYGGKKSLGWSIDYQKFSLYLKEKYNVSQIFYFGGVEIHHFPFDYLLYDTVPINELERYLLEYITKNRSKLTEAGLVLFDRHLRRVRFYLKLATFGYTLLLKPVKMYEGDNGLPTRKANCDVDMAFNLMKGINDFDRAIVLSGDGDFLPVLKHLRNNKKDVVVFARGERTAKEIRKFAGGKFLDFVRLQHKLSYDEQHYQ